MPRDELSSESSGVDLPDRAEAIEVASEYDFNGTGLHAIMRSGEAWFVAAEVCAVLEHTNPSVAVGRLGPDERGVSIVYTPGGPQEVRIISESGLYALVLTSRKPQAKAFSRWVRGTVLPSLRRTAMGQSIPSEPGKVHLSLETPGRYLVSALPGHPVHVQRMSVLSVGRDMRANDVEVLALNCQMIGSLWRRLHTLRSMEIPTDRGFTDDQLDRAITNAEQVGGQFLRAMREDSEEDRTA